MTVTSAPIGSSGQSLDGFAVNANVPDAFRESVVITDPSDPIAAVQVTSTQPIGFYGIPVWLQGSPNIVLAGTSLVQVLGTSQVSIPGTTSVFVVSSVPNVLAGTSQIFGQVSTFPSSTFVTNLTTTSVNVISTVPHTIVGTSQVFGIVSSQIISSIPLIVSQSTTAWQVQVTNMVNVNLTSSITQNTVITSSVPIIVAQSTSPWIVSGSTQIVSSLPILVTQSTSPWAVAGTTTPNIVSSIPFFVAQSSAPWAMYEIATTQTNTKCTSVVLQATLNTTVIKAGPGVITAYQMSNFSSTSVYVKFANASSAVIASTAMYMQRIGLAPSTSIYVSQDIGMNFSTGIVMFTTRNVWDADLTAPLGSTCAVNLCFL